MKNVFFRIFVLALFFSFGARAAGTTSRTASLDSRFFTIRSSNQAVGSFGIEYFDFQNQLFDWTAGTLDGLGTRSVGLVGFNLLQGALRLPEVWVFTFHEYGHAGRARAFGYAPEYHANYLNPTDGGNSFLPFFLSSLFNGYGGGSTSYSVQGNPSSSAARASITMAGINNSMYFSELLADKIRHEDGHLGYLIPFLNGRLDSYRYALWGGGDVANIHDYYAFQGYGVEDWQLRTGGLVSLFASASFYELAYAQYRFVTTERPGYPCGESGQLRFPTLASISLPGDYLTV